MELVDHLDELRSRLIASLTAFGVALGLCFWQNDLVLDVLNRPLDGSEPITLEPGRGVHDDVHDVRLRGDRS